MVIEILTANPEIAIALGLLLRIGLAWQSDLTWPEYRTLHAGKRALFPLLGGLFLNEKGYHDDAEYLLTTTDGLRSTVTRLRAGGGSLHLISSIKRRETPDGSQYSAAHLVWTHDDGRQTEAYLFPAVEEEGTDIYVHVEDSVTDPVGHLTDAQRDGDRREVVTDALDRNS